MSASVVEYDFDYDLGPCCCLCGGDCFDAIDISLETHIEPEPAF